MSLELGYCGSGLCSNKLGTGLWCDMGGAFVAVWARYGTIYVVIIIILKSSASKSRESIKYSKYLIF